MRLPCNEERSIRSRRGSSPGLGSTTRGNRLASVGRIESARGEIGAGQAINDVQVIHDLPRNALGRNKGANVAGVWQPVGVPPSSGYSAGNGRKPTEPH